MRFCSISELCLASASRCNLDCNPRIADLLNRALRGEGDEDFALEASFLDAGGFCTRPRVRRGLRFLSRRFPPGAVTALSIAGAASEA